MASLDDFFAKRDKKKSKTKKSVVEESVAKQPEDTIIDDVKKSAAAEVESVRKEVLVSPSKAEGAKDGAEAPKEPEVKAAVTQEAEVWAEFEEEKQVDYSGLRIQKLTMEDESQADSGSERKDGSKESESGEASISGQGPWNRVIAGTNEPAPAVEKTVVDLPNVNSSSVYVPPNMRSVSTVKPTRGRSKQAPDISSTDFFPTLEAAVEVPTKTKKQLEEEARGFAEAKPSRSHSRVTEQTAAGGGHLHLGNKYGVLSEN